MKSSRKSLKCAARIVLLFAVLLTATAPVTAFASGSYVEGEVLVVLKNGIFPSGTLSAASVSGEAGRSYVSSVAASAGAEAPVVYSYLSAARGKVIALMKSETKSTEELIADLKKNPNVLSVSPNYRTNALAVRRPNDSDYDTLWGLKKIRADEAWKVATGRKDVHVAVVDSGIMPAHPDLADNFNAGLSMNFVKEDLDDEIPARDKNYDDGDGHGTHVSGTIAATGNNEKGVTGVNWEAGIVALRTLNHENIGNTNWTLAALDYIVELMDNDPDLVLPVVNLSQGSWQRFTPAEMEGNAYGEAFKALDQTNRAVIVVAAGNDFRQVGAPANVPKEGNFSTGYYCYPGSLTGIDNMIVVGAINEDDDAAEFTNWSSKAVDVVAPGANIISTWCDGEYFSTSGTSMAAPHVSGAVALLAAECLNRGLPYDAGLLKRLILESANSQINPKAPTIDVKLEPPVQIPPQNVTDTTVSKHGLLDVKAAMDALDEYEKSRRRGGGGCDAMTANFAIFVAVALCGLSVWRGAKRR
jgi:subtilisin family serine protease